MRRPSSSPSRGTSARPTATSSAASLRCGGSGTASTATPCATSGAATPVCSATSRSRFTGSSDLFARPGRRPTASVNLITVHDGFTLADLVSYDGKHNEANGEANRDGTDDNRSWNCGAEGPTTDPDIQSLAGPPAPGPAHHPAPVVRRAPPARRRRTGPHPAGQQQRLLPGQRHHLVRLVPRRSGPARLHPEAPGAARGPPRVPPRAGFWPGRRRQSCGWYTPVGRGHDRGRLGRIPTLGPSPCTWTAPTIPTGPSTAACWSTTTSSCWSTPGGSRSTSSFPPPARARRGTARSTPSIRPGGPHPTRHPPGAPSTSGPDPSSCGAGRSGRTVLAPGRPGRIPVVGRRVFGAGAEGANHGQGVGLNLGSHLLREAQVAACVHHAELPLGSTPADEGAGPLEQGGQPVAEAGQEGQVDEGPDHPAGKPAQAQPAEVDDGPEPPDRWPRCRGRGT